MVHIRTGTHARSMAILHVAIHLQGPAVVRIARTGFGRLHACHSMLHATCVWQYPAQAQPNQAPRQRQLTPYKHQLSLRGLTAPSVIVSHMPLPGVLLLLTLLFVLLHGTGTAVCGELPVRPAESCRL